MKPKEKKDNRLETRPGPDMHPGCGGNKPLYSGKSKKICADCRETVEVDSNEIICPKCEGPLDG